jgi:deazaflavin-dependent oxidoreductase (nitroreductase family)
MRAVRSNPISRAGWRLHRLVYGRWGGRLGTRIGPHPVLLLTTRGRRTGAERTVPLNYLDTPSGPVVIGSYAGEPRDPAWALNLRARPEAEIRIGRQTHQVRALELHGENREAMAQKFEAIDASYRVYRQRTDRVLPVFRLERV